MITLGYIITLPADILTNIALLVMPMPLLWKLQMDFWRKVAVTGVFLLGSFAVIGSIVRVPLYHELDLVDVSWAAINPGTWLNVELAIGIVSACLPLLRPLFTRKFRSRLLSRFSRSGTDGSHRILNANSNGFAARSKTLENGGIYTGGGIKRQPKSWYTNTVSTGAGKSELRTSEEGSQEGMVLMGAIQVRHDLKWEQEDERSMVT